MKKDIARLSWRKGRPSAATAFVIAGVAGDQPAVFHPSCQVWRELGLDTPVEGCQIVGRQDFLPATVRSLEQCVQFGLGDLAGCALRIAESSGRPLGNDEFIAGLECILGRRIAKRAPGRKPKAGDDGQTTLL